MPSNLATRVRFPAGSEILISILRQDECPLSVFCYSCLRRWPWHCFDRRFTKACPYVLSNFCPQSFVPLRGIWFQSRVVIHGALDSSVREISTNGAADGMRRLSRICIFSSCNFDFYEELLFISTEHLLGQYYLLNVRNSECIHKILLFRDFQYYRFI